MSQNPNATPTDALDALIYRACAETSFEKCREDLELAAEVWSGSLVAVCDYSDGTGDVVRLEKKRQAASKCSGGGLISPSRVVTVVRLP
jgi:hypothetical protein